MKHLFVPYELALKLKEKGFDEECLFYYTVDGLIHLVLLEHTKKGYRNSKINKNLLTAPLYQQVIDWFRKKHIRIVEHPASFDNAWLVTLDTKAPKKLLEKYEHTGFMSLEKAIEEALKLIP